MRQIKKTEEARTTAAKYKWYLKERYGTIRTLLVQDFRLHQILAILGALELAALLGAFSLGGQDFSHDYMLIRAVP